MYPNSQPQQYSHADYARMLDDAKKYAQSMLENGTSPAAAYDMLVSKGIDPAVSQKMISDLLAGNFAGANAAQAPVNQPTQTLHSPPPPNAPVPDFNNPAYRKLVEDAKDSAYSLYEGGTRPDAIYDVILRKGVDPASAQKIVQDVMAGRLTDTPTQRSNSGNNIAIGLVMMVIGIAITVISYSAASSGSGGGRYVVTYGLIIFGLIRLIKGLAGK
jgi:hypothetical protein